jgi:hypothetical protein
MKFLKIASVTTIVVVALAVLGVTLAFAQNPNPPESPWWNAMRSMMQGNNGARGYGGMMNGNWDSMQQMHDLMTQSGGMDAVHAWMHQDGGMHERVFTAVADQLGLTSDELSAQFEGGKTLAQIAEEKGVATQDLAAIMEEGMKAGLEQAVKDGAITQEQADLMLQHMDGQFEWMITNMGAGMMGSGSGMMGPGGMMGPNGSGGCHDADQTTEDNTSL